MDREAAIMKLMCIIVFLLMSCSSNELEIRYQTYIEACNDVSYELFTLMKQANNLSLNLGDHQRIAYYCNTKTQRKYENFKPKDFFDM